MKKNILVIDINDSKDTEKYLDILRKHKITLSKMHGGRTRSKVSIVDTTPIEFSDEEARMSAVAKGHTLEFILGEIDNQRKRPGMKLQTPKAAQTFILKEKERSLKEDGIYGQYSAFLMNLINAELLENYGIPLLPQTEESKSIPNDVIITALSELQYPMIVEKKDPNKINYKKIAEKVIGKKKHLAKEEKLVIQVLKALLELK